MRNKESNREKIRLKLTQAQDALKEAEALLAAGAELSFVMNSLYYAFLYPMLGMLQAITIPAPTQSAAVALFEREFVMNGEVDRRFLDAARKAFELRPSCACEGQKQISREDVERLLPVCREFLKAMELRTQ
jgi:uncharacterized protein (UPF0332 family)